jgi:hypothetical protein
MDTLPLRQWLSQYAHVDERMFDLLVAGAEGDCAV